MSAALLINDTPLQLLPVLAVRIGLNEAIILQQIHFWVRSAERRRDERHFRAGHWWVWNDYEDWQRDNFPFWSARTIRRIVADMESSGLLLTWQPGGQDRTKWYRIDYDKLENWNGPTCPDPIVGIEDSHAANLATCMWPSWPHAQSYTESLSEKELKPSRVRSQSKPSANGSNHSHNLGEAAAPDPVPFDAFWGAYPKRVGKARAESLWQHLSTSDRDAVMASLPEYLRYCEEDERPIRDPCTFLNPKERFWTTEFATVPRRKVRSISATRNTNGYVPPPAGGKSREEMEAAVQRALLSGDSWT